MIAFKEPYVQTTFKVLESSVKGGFRRIGSIQQK